MSKTNNVKVCIIFTKDLKKQIEELSVKKNISQNALVRLAISEYIERNK